MRASARAPHRRHAGVGPATRRLRELVALSVQTAVGLGAVRDYKRAGDGDTGPLTAGMGACAPSPDLTAEEEEAIMRLVLPRDPRLPVFQVSSSTTVTVASSPATTSPIDNVSSTVFHHNLTRMAGRWCSLPWRPWRRPAGPTVACCTRA
jgi:hypothetical protein